MEFLKVWPEHKFYYIRHISVYIQPRYFYLIFRSVNGNNMNRVILHSVRPSFWKKRAFSHAPGCGSTESGCEISVPWWLILADLGKTTSVWSRDRDTGDTSEYFKWTSLLSFFSRTIWFKICHAVHKCDGGPKWLMSVITDIIMIWMRREMSLCCIHIIGSGLKAWSGLAFSPDPMICISTMTSPDLFHIVKDLDIT